MPFFEQTTRTDTSRRADKKQVMVQAQRRRHEAEARQAKRDEQRRAAKRALKKLRRGY